jgi:hypothetical protein
MSRLAIANIGYRGVGNTPKVTLADVTCMKLDTIITNMEQERNEISAVSSALSASNGGEEASEVRERREQQKGKERNLECVSGEIHRQVSPRAQGPIIFNRATVCVTRDISALHLGMRKPWASLNQRHHHSHPCKPSSSTPIQIIQHPHGIGPTKPIITFPVTMSFKRPFIHTTTTNRPHHKHPRSTSSKVPNQSPSTPLFGHLAVI